MDKLHELVMEEHIEFVEINENVLTACMTTCMSTMKNDSGTTKK